MTREYAIVTQALLKLNEENQSLRNAASAEIGDVEAEEEHVSTPHNTASTSTTAAPRTGAISTMVSQPVAPIATEITSLSPEERQVLQAGLTLTNLAERLKRSKPAISIAKSEKSGKPFTTWSKELDPTDIAWWYDEEKKIYFPVGI